MVQGNTTYLRPFYGGGLKTNAICYRHNTTMKCDTSLTKQGCFDWLKFALLFERICEYYIFVDINNLNNMHQTELIR